MLVRATVLFAATAASALLGLASTLQAGQTAPDRDVELLGSVATDSQPVRVISIRNRSSLELADLLNRMLNTGFLPLDEDAPMPQAQSALPPAPETLFLPPPPADPEMSVLGVQVTPVPATARYAQRGDLLLIADEVTNTLLVAGERNLVDKLEALIATLDVMPPQVMLEVLILNLSDTDSLDLGVEIRRIKDEGTIVSLSSLFGIGAVNPTDLVIPGVSGFTGVVLDPGDFSVLVNALQVLNKGRALNIPKVLVNSNQKANLASVLQTPFLSTNATDVIATTTFGGTQDAGTTIFVRPQIAEGDHLVLDYSIVLSTFVGLPSDPSLPPPRQQNNLQSTATIPDGYTIALGGLETTSATEGIGRVPYLGVLPVFGWLFRAESLVTSHSRFYVFIRASILRSVAFQHLKFLSDIDLHRSDLDPGWPEVEPALIR
jgi:general secretion pathway protein D